MTETEACVIRLAIEWKERWGRLGPDLNQNSQTHALYAAVTRMQSAPEPDDFKKEAQAVGPTADAHETAEGSTYAGCSYDRVRNTYHFHPAPEVAATGNPATVEVAAKPVAPDREDEIEAAFWEFDARRKGYGRDPQSERDAFKWTLRGMHTAPLVAERAMDALRQLVDAWENGKDRQPWVEALSAARALLRNTPEAKPDEFSLIVDLTEALESRLYPELPGLTEEQCKTVNTRACEWVSAHMNSKDEAPIARQDAAAHE